MSGLAPVTDASCNPISEGFLVTWFDPNTPVPLGVTRTFQITVYDNDLGITTNTINWGDAVPPYNKQYSSVILNLTTGHTYNITIISIEGLNSSTVVFSSLTPGATGLNTLVTDYLNTEYLSNATTLTANTNTQILNVNNDLELFAKTAIGSPTINITMGSTDKIIIGTPVRTAVESYNLSTNRIPINYSIIQVNTSTTTGVGTPTEVECTFRLTKSNLPPDFFDLYTAPYNLIQVTNKLGDYTVITPESVTNDATYFTVVFKTVPQSSYAIFAELNNGPAAPCFPTGTRILTHQGYKNVEDINDKEDKVITSDGRTVPCVVVSTHITKTNKNSAPYKIEANAFGPMSPPKDILLSPQHAIQSSKDVWQIPEYVAKHNPKVYQVDIGKPITYYHIECPNYFTDNLVAEDAVVESLGWYQVSDQNVYEFDPEIQGLRRTEQKQKRYAVFEQIEQEKGLNMKLAF
jgi:hypothetical protein